MSWMNLNKEYSGEASKYVILPIEYEKDVTYGKGASSGSKAIIEASKHLEYYDEEFDKEPFVEGIKLADSLNLIAKIPENMVDIVDNKVKELKNKFVIGLGGDHAVSIGMIKGMEAEHGDFSVIVLDAHSDFRDSWNNSSLNHACVSKQISKKHSLAIIGVRSMDIDEAKEIDEKKDVHLIKAYDLDIEKLDKVIDKLKDKVYISIDVDVFDPSFIRNTGTPEPGGFSWNKVIGILKTIFDNKQVIGCDIVEFAPKVNYEAEAYALAKLAYKIMALKKQQL